MFRDKGLNKTPIKIDSMDAYKNFVSEIKRRGVYHGHGLYNEPPGRNKSEESKIEYAKIITKIENAHLPFETDACLKKLLEKATLGGACWFWEKRELFNDGECDPIAKEIENVMDDCLNKKFSIERKS